MPIKSKQHNESSFPSQIRISRIRNKVETDFPKKKIIFKILSKFSSKTYNVYQEHENDIRFLISVFASRFLVPVKISAANFIKLE